VSGGDQFIRLWQPTLGQSLGGLVCAQPVGAIAFAPDGRTLAAGKDDGGLVLLQTATPEVVQREITSAGGTDAGTDLRAETEYLRFRARRNLASFLAREGEPSSEKEWLEIHIAELEKLIKHQPERLNLQTEQVKALLQLAQLQGDDHSARERLASRAADHASRMSDANPSWWFAVELRAAALYHLGYALYRQQRYNDARAPLLEALELYRRLEKTDFDPDRGRAAQMATTFDLLGKIQRLRKKAGEAVLLFRESIASHQAVLRTEPLTEDRRAELCNSLGTFLQLAYMHNLVVEDKDPKWWDEALDTWRFHVQLLEQRVLYAPRDVERRNELANWLRMLDQPLCWQGVRDKRISPDEADDCSRRAVEHFEVCIQLEPNKPRHRGSRWRSTLERGALLVDLKRYPAAEQVFAEVDVHRKAMGEVESNEARTRHELEWAVARAMQSDNLAEASRILEQALRESRQELADPGKKEVQQRTHAILLRTLARVELYRKQHAKAFAALTESLSLPADQPMDRLVIGLLLGQCERMVYFDEKLTGKELVKAVQRYTDKAMETLREAIKMEPALRARLKKDPDLDGLRQREDFKKLLKGGSP
jgi:tetratricopeptide (TPR) repeat protein